MHKCIFPLHLGLGRLHATRGKDGGCVAGLLICPEMGHMVVQHGDEQVAKWVECECLDIWVVCLGRFAVVVLKGQVQHAM